MNFLPKEIPDTRVTEELAYVSVANKYLVQQLEWLQAMNNRGKGSDESGEGGLIGQQALLENIKYEDALLQLLLKQHENEQRAASGLAFFSGKSLDVAEGSRSSLELLPALDLQRADLAAINAYMYEYSIRCTGTVVPREVRGSGSVDSKSRMYIKAAGGGEHAAVPSNTHALATTLEEDLAQRQDPPRHEHDERRMEGQSRQHSEEVEEEQSFCQHQHQKQHQKQWLWQQEVVGGCDDDGDQQEHNGRDLDWVDCAEWLEGAEDQSEDEHDLDLDLLASWN